jgi:hypothetical protein
MKILIALWAMLVMSLSAAAGPTVPSLGHYAGTYQLATKWGGTKGTWKPFQEMLITSTSEVYFNSALLPASNITTSTNAAGAVEYRMVFPDGAIALVNFQSNPTAGYYFDANVQGWGVSGVYQPNSPASGGLDLRGVPVKISDPAIQQLSRYAGTYKLYTKWGGNKGKWEPFQNLVVTSASEVFFNSAFVPYKNITATTTAAAEVEYKITLPDGAYALVKFQQDGTAGYYFDGNVRGLVLTGAFQPNSSATGLLDLRGLSTSAEVQPPVVKPSGLEPNVIAGGPAGISVKLVDSKGAGLSGATAEMRAKYAKAMGTTGTDGLATVNAEAGAYTFAITYRGQTKTFGPVNVTSGSVVVFTTAPVEVALTGGTGQLAAANVEHKGSYDSWIADGATSSAGLSSVQLLPGKYTFRVTFRGQTSQVETAVAGPTKVEFGLVPTTVKLTGASKPLKTGTVAHRGAGVTWTGDGTTAADGSVKFLLLAGTYTFSMEYRGQTNELASVAIAAPASVVEFPLAPTTVTVQTANGAPVEGAAIEHQGNTGQRASDGVTGSDGKVAFDLLGGAYTVSATKGGTTTSVQATVPPGSIIIKR